MASNTLQYIINFTDPLTTPFVVNPYTSNGATSPLSNVLDVTATNANTSLLFYGKGHPNYGQGIEENFVYLLESFSSGTPPINPISGQIWYQRYDILQTNSGWFLWDDNTETWTAITITLSSTAPDGSPMSGNQYQLNTVSNILYYGVIVPGNALNNQWLERSYSINNTVSIPTIDTLPQKQLRVYTGETAGRGWQSVNNMFVGTTPPTDPDLGTLWFDTASSILFIYNGTAFVTVVSGGVLPIAEGGTGQTTSNSALNALLPDQSSSGGFFLTTDGANTSWVPISTNASGGSVSSVNIAAGSVGLTVSGSPITTSGTIILTVDPELQGITQLSSTGFVQRTGPGTYVIEATLSLSDITTGLGYTPLNVAGDTMLGNLILNADPTNALGAVTKQYVDNQTIIAGSLISGILTLNYGDLVRAVTITGSFLQPIPYMSVSGDLMSTLPVPPTQSDQAIHNLDNIIKRRTRVKRFVIPGVTNQTTYNTPLYVTGSNRLRFYVDGVKWTASTIGYQRVLFTLPNTINQLDDSVITGLIAVTSYDFNIAVDSGSVTNITGITGNSVLTFYSLVQLINTRFTALSISATAVLDDENAITIYSNTIGTGSSINITAGTIDLFSVMTYFNKLGATSDGISGDPDKASGNSYGYNEVGHYGSSQSTITISNANPDLPINSNLLEFLVVGGKAGPYLD